MGGDAVALLAGEHGARFKKARRFIRAEVAEVRIADGLIVLVRPLTFMNESGQAVAPLLRYYKVAPENMLVIHDDIDLPFAKLRVQFDSSSGGNNGVESIIGSVRSREFWRLKCGVGRPPGRMDPADFVLRKFAVAEREEAELMKHRAGELVELFVASGGEAARQRAGELK